MTRLIVAACIAWLAAWTLRGQLDRLTREYIERASGADSSSDEVWR